MSFVPVLFANGFKLRKRPKEKLRKSSSWKNNIFSRSLHVNYAASVPSTSGNLSPDANTLLLPTLPGINDLTSDKMERSDQDTDKDKPKKTVKHKTKKAASWYNVLSTNYKTKVEHLRKYFKDIPETEKLLVDYSCAYQKEILVHGRLYITQNYACFHANILGWETFLVLNFKDVISIVKEKTVKVIPNAIQFHTDHEKHFFASFAARDKTFMVVFRLWQNALLKQPLTSADFWDWIREHYGEELGITDQEEGYQFDILETGPLITENKPPQIKNELSTTGYEGNESVNTPDNEPNIAINSEDIIVEPSNSVELEESECSETGDEIDCSCDRHGKVMINSVYSINVDDLFQLLFTESDFFKETMSNNGNHSLVFSPWSECEDQSGSRVRVLKYTVSIKSSVGPKTADCTETQTMLNLGKPGQMYIVQCRADNAGIPYSDVFSVINKFCLTRVSSTHARLRISNEIKYHKTVLGFIKGFIEKNVVSACKEYFKSLSQRLSEISNSLSNPGSAKSKRRGHKRQRSQIPDISPALTDSAEAGPSSAINKTHVSVSEADSQHITPVNTVSSRYMTVIFIMLVVLIMCNLVLYSRMASLENATSNILSSSAFQEFSGLPDAEDRWQYLMKKHRDYQIFQSSQWKNVLGASIALVQEVEDSLQQLRDSLDITDTSTEGGGCTSGL